MYLTTKMIQTNRILSAACISLDKKLKDQSGALLSPFFAFLHHKTNEWKTYVFKQFVFSLHIQNRQDPHKISFSEPVALFMNFSTLDNEPNI